MSRLLGVPKVAGYTDLFATVSFPAPYRGGAAGLGLLPFHLRYEPLDQVWMDLQTGQQADLPFASSGNPIPEHEISITFRATFSDGSNKTGIMRVLPAENVPGALNITLLP